MDDEEMMAMDDKLGAAVRALLGSKGGGAGSARERQRALLGLQLRAAALLEEWCKKVPGEGGGWGERAVSLWWGLALERGGWGQQHPRGCASGSNPAACSLHAAAVPVCRVVWGFAVFSCPKALASMALHTDTFALCPLLCCNPPTGATQPPAAAAAAAAAAGAGCRHTPRRGPHPGGPPHCPGDQTRVQVPTRGVTR
jgi:hypothetical protein